MKVNDAYKAEEGYKNISKHFHLAVSTVWNVIKNWQLKGTVEVNVRSGRPRNLTNRTVCSEGQSKSPIWHACFTV